jgi:hypothetical protein
LILFPECEEETNDEEEEEKKNFHPPARQPAEKMDRYKK